MPSDPRHQFQPLLGFKQWTFLDVLANPHDEFLDESAAPLDDIQMAQSDWVKRTGVDGQLNTVLRVAALRKRVAGCGVD